MTVTAEKKVQISDLHFELNLWLNEFKFYKDEIKIFKKRLEEIVSRNTDKEVMKEVEHFENQYLREREVIDELRHEIKQHENLIEREDRLHPVAVDHEYMTYHNQLKDQVKQFRKIYQELRDEFMDSLGRWL